MERSERSPFMPARRLLVVALAIACHGALAQSATSTTVPAPLAVQRLAPQLVTFAGSEANFQSLVNGLASGSLVQLVTVLPNGFQQLVTFTPAAASSPAQIAQILESARQRLIGLGIGAPTAEQIGFMLMGGVVPTPVGGTQVSGLVNGTGVTNPPSTAAQMQQQSASGATSPTTTSSVTNAVNVTTTPSAATPTATVAAPRQTSDSLVAPGATSRTALPPTSTTPILNTSASPLASTPAQAPGAGSQPGATERVPAGIRASGRN
jgi:hypothetical protein